MRTEQGKPVLAAEPPRRLTLEEQTRLTATGIAEVLRVEPQAVVLRAGDRILAVRGEGLALKQLTPGEGCVEIRGTVSSVSFGEAPAQGGLLRRLFG